MRMNMHVYKALGLLLVGCFGQMASGNEPSYQCRISEQLHLQPDGSLKRPGNAWLMGARFSVNRETGALASPESSLWTSQAASATVLARGNSQSSFIVVVASPAAHTGVHGVTIEIRESEIGRTKPFVAISGSQAVSGLCESLGG
jgi:hypothetical protein